MTRRQENGAIAAEVVSALFSAAAIGCFEADRYTAGVICAIVAIVIALVVGVLVTRWLWRSR